MKNKVFVVIIVILAGLLILETNYLLHSRQRMRLAQRIPFTHHKPMPMHRNFENDFSDFDEPMRDSFAGLEQMQRRMNRMFENDLSDDFQVQGIPRRNMAFTPGINVNETENAYIIKADLPGMDKNTINVEVKGRNLVLSGERKEEASQEEKNFYRQELSYGSFLRSIPLPQDAKPNQIVSQYSNGVLTITIPREKSKTQEPETIKVPIQ
jgi:HSP20 family protein